MNQCAFRHSARNLPLNDSMKALSVGLPGREKPVEKLPYELLLAPPGQRHAHSSVRSQEPLTGGHARSADDLERAETGHEIDEDHFAAVAFHELASHHLLAPVVAAFGQDLGRTRRISSSGVS
jgi:hypothetical protein